MEYVFSPLDHFPNVFEIMRCCTTAYNQTSSPWHDAMVRPKVWRSRDYFILECRVYSTIGLNKMMVLVTEDCISDTLAKGCNTKHNFRQRCTLWDRGKLRVVVLVFRELGSDFPGQFWKTGTVMSNS